MIDLGRRYLLKWHRDASNSTTFARGEILDREYLESNDERGADVAQRVVALTLSDPPVEATHWTGAMMAKVAGISVSSVQRMWRAHGLQPHRVRQFKLSNDPKFVNTLRDVVGLYVDPPAHTPSFCR